eukprot:scaffold99471_cov51-Phaeocystis_antarctica.AAC.1
MLPQRRPRGWSHGRAHAAAAAAAAANGNGLVELLDHRCQQRRDLAGEARHQPAGAVVDGWRGLVDGAGGGGDRVEVHRLRAREVDEIGAERAQRGVEVGGRGTQGGRGTTQGRLERVALDAKPRGERPAHLLLAADAAARSRHVRRVGRPVGRLGLRCPRQHRGSGTLVTPRPVLRVLERRVLQQVLPPRAVKARDVHGREPPAYRAEKAWGTRAWV